jgi:hypothetical protein
LAIFAVIVFQAFNREVAKKIREVRKEQQPKERGQEKEQQSASFGYSFSEQLQSAGTTCARRKSATR